MIQRLFPRLAMAVLLVLTAIPARADDPDRLKKQTVQIKVVREDSTPEFGSGVILCQIEGYAYILTAHHVLFGKSENGKKSSRRDVKTTEIRFYRDLAPTILEDRDKDQDLITPFPVQGKDLALIVIAMAQDLPIAALGRTPSEAEVTSGAKRHVFPVTAVGHDKGGLQVWIESQGELLRRDAHLLIHSAPIQEGFSGGPLFDESGALIGLNVELGTERGEGQTLPIEDMIESLRASIPKNCSDPPSQDLSESDAIEIYKRAVREISLQRWDRAVPLLRDAIEKKFLEGGSVHLQGMRYTSYLPHYHLGLALYNLGKYREAHRELTISENQRVIQDDKRYHTLVKTKKAAADKKNAQFESPF